MMDRILKLFARDKKESTVEEDMAKETVKFVKLGDALSPISTGGFVLFRFPISIKLKPGARFVADLGIVNKQPMLVTLSKSLVQVGCKSQPAYVAMPDDHLFVELVNESNREVEIDEKSSALYGFPLLSSFVVETIDG